MVSTGCRPPGSPTLAVRLYGPRRHPGNGDLPDCHTRSPRARGPSISASIPGGTKREERQRIMSEKTRDDLLPLVQSFFQSYLHNMRGASHHTIRSYRDALRLFFLFLVRRGRRSIADLRLDDIQAEAVLTFLDHGESFRGNSPATRNCRLAAIRSFAQHLLRHDVTRANQYGRILAVSPKRKTIHAAAYLEPESARAIIAAVDLRTAHGA